MDEALASTGGAGRGRWRRSAGAAAALASDTRGAIYVLGIVLGAVLFGVAWNLANVGGAIVWRERAQDLADAAAFENALAHARGMNLLVMANLIMVVVLSFLVLWRMLLLAMLALAIPTFGLSLSVASFMSEQGSVLASRVHELVSAGPYLQKVVALSTPHVAARRAEALLRESYPGERVLSLATFSASSFPTELAARVAAAERAARASTAAGPAPSAASSTAAVGATSSASPAALALAGASLAELNRDPARLLAFATSPAAGFGAGLPARAESWDTLCNTAAEAAALRLGEGDFAVPGLDAVGRGLRQWGLDRAMQSAPDPFCADWNGARDRAVSLATTACKVLGGGVAERFCARVARRAVSPFFGGPAPSLGAERPALLAAPEHFVNGNASAQSWSFVELDRQPWLGLARAGLEVMDGARSGGPAPAPEPIAAQFEMYFDCDERWSRCADDSLLRLAWRARGRVLNPPLPALLLGGALELGRGRLGQLARSPAELGAPLQRWAHAALQRALPEAGALREHLLRYGDAAVEQRLLEPARSLLLPGGAPAGSAVGAVSASATAAAAERLRRELAGGASIVAH